MKTSKICLSLTLIMTLFVGASTSETVFAAGRGHGGGWHGGGRVGIYLGVPFGFNYGYYPYSYYGSPYYRSPYYGSPYYGSPYYGSPYYYSPAPVIYTERRDDPQIKTQEAPKNSSQKAQASWWYYCADSKAYYPYVNKCPGGWLRVAPQPASDSDDQPVVTNVPAP